MSIVNDDEDDGKENDSDDDDDDDNDSDDVDNDDVDQETVTDFHRERMEEHPLPQVSFSIVFVCFQDILEYICFC